ncbi:MAG: SH3 domain-containing protein [Smithellaceae bacterium]|nr:SH3 domain-containing protein [Smithellaceae bacterium]
MKTSDSVEYEKTTQTVEPGIGSKQESTVNTCKRCGAEISNERILCLECDAKLQDASKKLSQQNRNVPSVVVIISLVVLFLTAIIIGSLFKANKSTQTSNTSAPIKIVTKPAVQNAYVNAKSLNLREAPNTESVILGRYTRNRHLIIVGEIGDWYRVIIEDKEGYMIKDAIGKGAIPPISSLQTTKKGSSR